MSRGIEKENVEDDHNESSPPEFTGHRKSVPNRLKKFVYKAPNEITRLEYIASNLCYVDDTDDRFHFGQPTTASSPPSTAFEATKKSRNTPKLKLNTNNLPKTSSQNPDSGISPRDIRFLDFPNVDSLLSDLSTRDGLIENLRADVVSSETNEKVKELTDITINNLLNGPRPDDQIPSQTKSSRSDIINEDAIPYERELPSSSDFVFDSDVYSEQDVRLKTPLRLVLKLKPRRQSRNNSNELKYVNSADAFKERISSKFKRQRRNLSLHLTSFERNYQSLPTSPHLDSGFAGCVLKQPLAHATTSRSPYPPPYRLNTEALALSPCLSGKFKINEDSFRRNMHRINPKVHRGWNMSSPPTGGTFSTPLSGVSSYSQHTSTETPYPTEEYLF
ncbi:uncharacterized protein KQ657_003828 [Scheffersomyces spartinae]|uniref:Uncharacterized protein n=1 Tax=Scheffersomyces spartinae TaxID=45513 RepID=A0A9P8AKN8_9ASCO|nr:uncharacterized protein KQ657_003828 [Scheffersomyces spartinae]KAG7195302.1 hypothetical protein KQ657_003828 [Scheffersomyces spartinae]